jgi:hypothetical protein
MNWPASVYAFEKRPFKTLEEKEQLEQKLDLKKRYKTTPRRILQEEIQKELTNIRQMNHIANFFKHKEITVSPEEIDYIKKNLEGESFSNNIDLEKKIKEAQATFQSKKNTNTPITTPKTPAQIKHFLDSNIIFNQTQTITQIQI